MKAIGRRRRPLSDVGAAKADLAGVERVDAGQNLDQRRLAGAVLAEQRKNLAGPEGHADVRERFRAAEALEDAADLQQLARVRSLAVARAPQPSARPLACHRSSRGPGRIRRWRAFHRISGLRQQSSRRFELRKKPPAAREAVGRSLPCLRANALS